MKLFNINEPYYILLISIILYVCAYRRRIRWGERDLPIAPLVEKILFPFSGEGEAALISIIIAAYIEVSLVLSYIAIGILQFPVKWVNFIWSMGTWCMLLLGTGISLFHELPASRGNIILKILGYVIAVWLVLWGCGQFIGWMVNLVTGIAKMR